MSKKTEHRIKAVEPMSIAAELGLQAGDFLLALDDAPLIDIFDYQWRQLKQTVSMTVRKQGKIIEYDIEKEEDEDLGLLFDSPLMQDCDSCENHCVFCFVDQLPEGLRQTLYFKDDDLRLSFLHGNYATLTNLSDEALDRLIGYRFSPMNVSVHTTNPTLRQKMMRHPRAGRIMEQLKRIASAGLSINCQIVLCPDFNDGAELDRTLSDLISLYPSVSSIAIVPVGLTRYRKENGLTPLRSFTEAESAFIIRTVHALQQRCLSRYGTRLVYVSDEFYLQAKHPFPDPDAYEDYPQLENGVGLSSLFLSELRAALADSSFKSEKPVLEAGPALRETDPSVFIATGTAAAPLIEPFCTQLQQRANARVQVKAVENHFFGQGVTVAGLLTGRDLMDQLGPIIESERQRGFQPLLVLPSCLLKADEPIFLDDLTLWELSSRLAVPIWISKPDGSALIGLMDRIRERGLPDE